MPRHRHTVEQIITKLREAEVALKQRAARSRTFAQHRGLPRQFYAMNC